MYLSIIYEGGYSISARLDVSESYGYDVTDTMERVLSDIIPARTYSQWINGDCELYGLLPSLVSKYPNEPYGKISPSTKLLDILNKIDGNGNSLIIIDPKNEN